VFSSCVEETLNESNLETNEINNDDLVSNLSLQTEIEKNEIFTYKDSSINKNYKFQRNFDEWNFEEIDLSTYENIKRIGDSLIFYFPNSTFMLINEEYDEELENYEASDFKMVKFHEKQNIAEIHAICYEYSYYVLVDFNAADTIWTFGQPLFNRDNSLIFSANVDLESGYTENGFEIISKDPHGFTKLNTTLLDRWGVSKASWIAENRILVQKVTKDEKYNDVFTTGIITLDLRKIVN
jgi:hypothetical protein